MSTSNKRASKGMGKPIDLERYGATTKACAVAAGIHEDDAFQLAGIELACAVADSFSMACDLHSWDLSVIRVHCPTLYENLGRLEAATRGSALRKVRP